MLSQVSYMWNTLIPPKKDPNMPWVDNNHELHEGVIGIQSYINRKDC